MAFLLILHHPSQVNPEVSRPRIIYNHTLEGAQQEEKLNIYQILIKAMTSIYLTYDKYINFIFR